ncbi:MAG: hypothetical protein RR630_03155 [Coprobacillus sp.]
MKNKTLISSYMIIFAIITYLFLIGGNIQTYLTNKIVFMFDVYQIISSLLMIGGLILLLKKKKVGLGIIWILTLIMVGVHIYMGGFGFMNIGEVFITAIVSAMVMYEYKKLD